MVDASNSSIIPPCTAVILAACKSTRMRSDTPKTLHPVCGIPITEHVVRACKAAGVERVIIVVGHQADRVRQTLGSSLEYAVQTTQRGTGDAVMAAEPLLRNWTGDVLILAGDAPLISSETLRSLIQCRAQTNAPVAMLTARLDDPTGYGRILRDAQGQVSGIVEHRDATNEQLKIKEWNPSIYVFEAASLWNALSRVTPGNSQSEFYLTDTIGILASDGKVIESIETPDPAETLGVNTRVELADVTRIMQQRINRKHMLSGVTMIDPTSIYVDVDVTIQQDTTLYPGSFLQGSTSIGEQCTIGPNAVIRNSTIANGTSVVSSQIVDSRIGSGVRVGPFANLRPGSNVGNSAAIGDFVEIKNATLADGVKVSHLSYIGDAIIGENTNVGAGTITCNYDGFQKHKTEIGAGAFIGSHSTLIAPVKVGEGAITAAGSTITKDVPADALAIARVDAVIKERWAARYREARNKNKK